MDMSGRGYISVAKTCLSSARSCLLSENYGRAYANYLLFLKLVPSRREEVMEDFVMSMRKWTEKLEKEGRIDHLFKCYDQACEVVPNCVAVLNNIGAQLFRLGYVEEASLYIRKAIQINPSYLAARQNLENINSHLVERWHFRMLNDKARNSAYRAAVNSAVQEGHHSVLDIGTGTGILSLFAVEAGTSKVYACEQSKTMFGIAKNVLQSNKGSEKINLFCKSSTDLCIPDDLPNRVTLVITETFDAAIFGENIINTLRHAWKELLDHNSNEVESRVIPSRAILYVCAIECEAVRNQNRFLYPGLQNLDIGDTKIVCTTGSTAEDPYTTENLSTINKGFRILSNVCSLSSVDFNNLEELEKLHSGVEWSIEMSVCKTGKLDAIALWFDLHLDEDIFITTNPTKMNCWEQAIFPVLPAHFRHSNTKACHFQDMTQTMVVRENEKLSVEMSLRENCLQLLSCHHHLTDIHHNYNCNQGDAIADLPCPSSPFLLERAEISKLNNIHLNRILCQTLDQYLRETCKTVHLPLLDMCYGLSPLGLQFVKNGFTGATVVVREDLHEMFHRLAVMNGVDTDYLNLVDASDISHIQEEHSIIICDIVEPSGIMRQRVLEDLALLRLNCLGQSGKVLPGKVTVHGVCVESEELQRDSSVVSDERTCGFKVAKHINEYQLSTHEDVDLSMLSHSKLTEPFQLLTFDLNEMSQENKPPSYLEQSKEIKVKVVEPGRLSAVIYWFEMEFTPGHCVSTVDTVSHWKQAAVMIGRTSNLIPTQELTFNVLLQNSCIDISVVNISDVPI